MTDSLSRHDRALTLPNTLIAGVQKSGTSWLHKVLNESSQFWGAHVKELQYWNQSELAPIEEYASHFADAPGSAQYLFEATPGYFQLPRNEIDFALRIRNGLGDIPLIVMVRNPVDRYLSAYTHHFLQGRLPAVSELTTIDYDKFGLVSRGEYGKIYRHFKQYFSTIHVHTYDELVESPRKLIDAVFNDFGLVVDVPGENLDLRVNDKHVRHKRRRTEADLPELAQEAERELYQYYRADIESFAAQTGLDLGAWLR
jgi:hypothetical protein